MFILLLPRNTGNPENSSCACDERGYYCRSFCFFPLQQWTTWKLNLRGCLGQAPVLEEALDPNRPSRLLIATVDQKDAALLRRSIDAAESRYSPQEILTAHTLEEVHAIVTGKPPPTAVLLDLHFETHTHNGIDFKTIAQDLADCRERYLAVMVSNGLTASDELKERERAIEYDMRPNALAKQSVLTTINGMRDLLLAMDCFLKKPPRDGKNTLMLSLLEVRRGTSVLG